MPKVDDISRLVVRLSPEPVCDDCIADRLGLSVRQQVAHRTRELGGVNGFVRSKGLCSLRGRLRSVTARC